uniref:hypothetical protein n=1 Tax=Agathobacter sp. TaxID=2021311 RepID=UPI0040559D38
MSKVHYLFSNIDEMMFAPLYSDKRNSRPNATYRSKAGKSYKGYSANIVEVVDENI